MLARAHATTPVHPSELRRAAGASGRPGGAAAARALPRRRARRRERAVRAAGGHAAARLRARRRRLDRDPLRRPRSIKRRAWSARRHARPRRAAPDGDPRPRLADRAASSSSRASPVTTPTASPRRSSCSRRSRSSSRSRSCCARRARRRRRGAAMTHAGRRSWLGARDLARRDRRALRALRVKRPKNPSYQPQDEFKLHNYVNLGIFSINQAVSTSSLAGILTCVTMIYVARRMQQRPNRVQTLVELDLPGAPEQHRRHQHGPPHGGAAGSRSSRRSRCSSSSRTSSASSRCRRTPTEHDQPLRLAHPAVLALRGDREPLDPARARARRVRLLHRRGRSARRARSATCKGLIPGGVTRRRWPGSSSASRCSRT